MIKILISCRFHKVKNYMVRDEEGRFVCEHCEDKFPNGPLLKRHEKTFHESEDRDGQNGSPLAGNTPCTVECSPTCGKVFGLEPTAKKMFYDPPHGEIE